jgi:hypothetical protein
MLAAVVLVTALLIGFGFYLVSHEETKLKGSAGALVESAPRSDPAPTFMQPGYRPNR